jgi:UDP-glucose:glycoprotein glucosyltransferase
LRSVAPKVYTNADRPSPQKIVLEKDTEEEEVPVITPLHASELAQLGVQAAQAITSSSSPMDTLLRLSQDFPSQSAKIASLKVNDSYADLFRDNSRVVPSGENLFWLNGMLVAKDKVEAFNLLSIMRRERGLVKSLSRTGLSNERAVEFLSHEKVAEKIEVGTVDRFDVRDDVEGGGVIMWLNDLEKDSRYREWPKALRNVTCRGVR